MRLGKKTFSCFVSVQTSGRASGRQSSLVHMGLSSSFSTGMKPWGALKANVTFSLLYTRATYNGLRIYSPRLRFTIYCLCHTSHYALVKVRDHSGIFGSWNTAETQRAACGFVDFCVSYFHFQLNTSRAVHMLPPPGFFSFFGRLTLTYKGDYEQVTHTQPSRTATFNDWITPHLRAHPIICRAEDLPVSYHCSASMEQFSVSKESKPFSQDMSLKSMSFFLYPLIEYLGFLLELLQ